MTDRLAETSLRLRDFVAERDWSQFHNPKNLAMMLASEAGELLAEYRWISTADADPWSQEPANRKRVSMEAADIAIALLLLCDRVGIDLMSAITEKIDINSRNYPVSTSKGRASRPNP